MSISPNIERTEVVIANTATVSSIAVIIQQSIVGFILPAGLAGTAITFQVSQDGITFVPLHGENGTAFTLTAAASRAIHVDPAIFLPWSHVRLVANAAQTGSMTIILMIRDI